MNPDDIKQTSESFQESHSIQDLGYLLQFLTLGMSRSQVETLLGKAQYTRPANAGSYYDISDLFLHLDPEDEKSQTMRVYLVVEFEGDEEWFEKARDEGAETQQAGLSTDKLLAFALETIN